MTLAASVVMPTRGRPASLKNAVESLIGQEFDRDRFEVIVVDNGPANVGGADIMSLQRSAAPPIRVLREEVPGASRARNAGWRAARAPFVLFVDDDCVAAPDLVTSALGVLSTGIPAVGGRVLVRLPVERPAWLTDALFLYLSQIDWPLDPGPLPPDLWLASCNLAVRRDVLDALGGFRTDLGPVGNRWRVEEDVELIRQIRRSGGPCWYDPRMVVHHEVTAERIRRGWFLHRSFWGGFSLARTSAPGTGAVSSSAARAAQSAMRRRNAMEVACLAAKAAGFAAGLLTSGVGER